VASASKTGALGQNFQGHAVAEPRKTYRASPFIKKRGLVDRVGMGFGIAWPIRKTYQRKNAIMCAGIEARQSLSHFSALTMQKQVI
jgi:hypothetical protein